MSGRPEILTAVQIGGLIELHRNRGGRGEERILRGEEVRIARGQEFIGRVRAVATVAIRLPVDDKTAEADQRYIFARRVDETRRDLQTE